MNRPRRRERRGRRRRPFVDSDDLGGGLPRRARSWACRGGPGRSVGQPNDRHAPNVGSANKKSDLRLFGADFGRVCLYELVSVPSVSMQTVGSENKEYSEKWARTASLRSQNYDLILVTSPIVAARLMSEF